MRWHIGGCQFKDNSITFILKEELFQYNSRFRISIAQNEVGYL